VSSLFRCTLATEGSFDKVEVATLGDVSTALAGAAPTPGLYKIDAPCTNASYFGRHMRFRLKYGSDVDTSMAWARFSVLLVIKTWGQ
jgi:hypothetical protein